MIEYFKEHMFYKDNGTWTVPWTVKDAFIGVALIVSASVLSFVSLHWLARGVELDVHRPLVLYTLALLLSINLVVVWYFAICKRNAFWATVGFTLPQERSMLLLPWCVLVISLFFSGVYTVTVMALGLDFMLPEPIPVDALGKGIYKVSSVIIIGLIGPLTEEVFYRGFLLAALVSPFGTVRAAVIASAIFAVNHGAISILIPVFISGMLLSWLYLKTRSLLPPMLAHAAQNLLALSLAA